MKLTCVTAVYNAIRSGNRERLVRCITSVARLSTEHEHLIYDGASDDGTVDLLRELEAKTPGVRVVSEKDTGIYNALNKGVRDATGEWFYVLGCDDYVIAPEVLDDLLIRHEEDADHIVAPVLNDNGKTLVRGGLYMRNIFFGNPYCHQGVVMRTQLVRDCGGFDERRRIFADYALLVESHRRGSRIVFEDRPYAVYYLGGISAQGHGVFPEETMSVSRKLLGVTDEEVAVFRKRVYFPLRRVIPFLTHKDKTFRRAAQYMIARNLLWHLGLKRPDTDAWYK